jgi:hypothetical protein
VFGWRQNPRRVFCCKLKEQGEAGLEKKMAGKRLFAEDASTNHGLQRDGGTFTGTGHEICSGTATAGVTEP